MSRLLHANFARLKQDKVFWLTLVFMSAFGLFMTITNQLNGIKFKETVYIDYLFFSYLLIIGIVLAVFCCLFLGTEYSDGTIRNKLMVGHTRGRIYLASLVVCTAAGLVMTLFSVVAAGAVGFPLFGFFKTDLSTVLAIFSGSLVMVAALSSIFTLLGMLIQNKAVAAVVIVLGIFAMLFAASYLSASLSAPEIYEGYTYTDESGNTEEIEAEPNPNYVSGTKRKVYETLMDVLPTGQGVQYANMAAEHLWQMPVYSVIIIIVTTGAGIMIFRRKDIK